MTFFDLGLVLASVICVAGLVWRVSKWCGRPVRNSAPFSPLKGMQAFVVDVLLLARTGRQSPLRWIGHTLIFVGFMGLLLFHALDDQITSNFFFGYESTLDPWQFLRNLFGLMVLVGLGIMTYRRVANKKLRELTRFQDWFAFLLVGGIILSGFFLEATKIMSPRVFDRMVYEYLVVEDGSDLTALKAVWADKYGVVFTERLPMNEETLARGMELDEESCMDCHSNTSSSFVSRTMATALTPIGPALNRSQATEVFWYLHLLLCFVGLAALPFGKFLHPLTTPANLIVRQGRRDGEGETPSVRKGLGLDACTRCGECSLHCSVAPAFSVMGNSDILPSEKLISFKKYQQGELFGDALTAFADGSRTCTECLRCTDICSAGINLQELWMEAKQAAQVQRVDMNMAVRQLTPKGRIQTFECSDCKPDIYGLADNKESYQGCVQCTTCTSVCPVVAVCEDASADLDLMPQQIMNLLRMGMKEEAMGARMVWSCTTCYKCQEHCPQNIRVADVLYELRNTAAVRMRKGNQ